VKLGAKTKVSYEFHAATDCTGELTAEKRRDGAAKMSTTNVKSERNFLLESIYIQKYFTPIKNRYGVAVVMLRETPRL
jgi:hypothetical protein